MFQDKTLTCRDCGNSFTFSAAEQDFYAQKGFKNEPARCPDCRKAKKEAIRASGRRDRQMYETTCSSCGEPTQVPFKPSGERPVYCWACYSAKK